MVLLIVTPSDKLVRCELEIFPNELNGHCPIFIVKITILGIQKWKVGHLKPLKQR